MKYCSHQHKNPDDAMFCHECGEKLQEAVKSNKCPKCNQENPKDARFCFNCGCSLEENPEPQEFYTLKVRSKKVCDKIFVKGQKFHSNIISKNGDGEFKIPKSDPVVDVINEYEGIEYKYNVDCRKTNDCHIYWVDIVFSSNRQCEEVKISGSNMSAPLVIKNVQKRILSVPAGRCYDVEAHYAGKSKKSTVVLPNVGTREVEMNFITDLTPTNDYRSSATNDSSNSREVRFTIRQNWRVRETSSNLVICGTLLSLLVTIIIGACDDQHGYGTDRSGENFMSYGIIAFICQIFLLDNRKWAWYLSIVICIWYMVMNTGPYLNPFIILSIAGYILEIIIFKSNLDWEVWFK